MKKTLEGLKWCKVKKQRNSRKEAYKSQVQFLQQYLLILVIVVRLRTWHVTAYVCCWKTWKAILLITRGFGKFEFATKDLQIGWQI